MQAIDSARQAGKTDQTIATLWQRGEIAELEIRDALDIPPVSLSQNAKTELIKELEHAEQRDRLEQQHTIPVMIARLGFISEAARQNGFRP
jgi:hypothetical protein